MFGFFGSGKKDDSPAQPQYTPQPPQEPQAPERIIEKKGINSWPENRGTRHAAIIGTFGTDDLDLIFERYAPPKDGTDWAALMEAARGQGLMAEIAREQMAAKQFAREYL